MPLASVITNNLQPLGPLDPGAAPTALGADGNIGGNSFSFPLQHQEQSNWCWAALAVSVAQYYDPETPWTTQCDLAGTEIGVNCCPTGTDPSHCNVPLTLPRGLNRVGHYAGRISDRPAKRIQIKEEIDAGRPLCAAISFAGTSIVHFVVISAYSWTPTSFTVTVEDPISGHWTDLHLDDLKTDYGADHGFWTFTYWTE